MGVGNAIGGSTSIYHEHGLWSAVLIGSGTYGLLFLARFLCYGDRNLPSLKIAALGLVFGIGISTAIGGTRSLDHRQEMVSWFQNLSDSERQQVRQHARRWIEKQSRSSRSTLEETARLMGYKSLEDFVVLNYCSNRLDAVRQDASRVTMR
jgi:hypothetical protein